MDFQGDHTALGTDPGDEIGHPDEAGHPDDIGQMYVPGAADGLGDMDGNGTGHAGGADPDGTGMPAESPGTISVKVGGHEVAAEATLDVDHDGRADTAIVTDSAGDHIAVTDADGDGEADHAALLDDSGRVLETAHLNPSGTWVPDGPGDGNPYGRTGAPIGTGSGDPSDRPGAPSDRAGAGGPAGPGAPAGGTGGVGGPPGGGSGHGGHPVTIEVGGHSIEAQATLDTDRDGTSDTAVVRAPDGTSISFTDSDGDGHADRATVYDREGALVGTAYYDPTTGTWIEGADPSAAPTLPGGAGITIGGAGTTRAAAGPTGDGATGDGATGARD